MSLPESSLQHNFNSLKKFTTRAWTYFIENSHTHPSIVAYAKYALPVKYKYERPAFLQLDEEAVLASADHEVRPIILPKCPILMNAGYAEVINAGKSLKTNEDQSCFQTFVVTVPNDKRKEGWENEMCHIPCIYFAVFDGHAGTGAALTAYNNLHHHVKEQLTNIAHMIVLPEEEFGKEYLSMGLILSVDAEKLVIGAIEQAFSAMDEDIKQQRYDSLIEGGCTALVSLFILGKLFVANAGDCRGIICRDGDPHPMSTDHNPETERKRLQTLAYYKPELLASHYTRYQFQHRCRKKDIGTKQLYRDFDMDGWTLKTIDRYDVKPQLVSGEGKRGRLLDTIGTTRGFGDHDLEVPYTSNIKIKPFLTPVPDVKVFDLSREKITDKDVLVMASDGLWERLSNEKVCEVVKMKLESAEFEKKCKYMLIAQTLVDEARGTLSERGWKMANNETASYDDISVFAIPLMYWKKILHLILKSHLTQLDNHEKRDDSFTEEGFLNIPHILKLTNELDDEKIQDDLNSIDNCYSKTNNIHIPFINGRDKELDHQNSEEGMVIEK